MSDENHVDIRYEVANISPQIADDLAILLMTTDKGRIAVHMRRTVLEDLFAELKQALKQ